MLKCQKMLDGKRLIELPSKDIILQKLEFTKEEREIYQMVCHFTVICSHVAQKSQVEARSQAKFKKFLRAGTVLK